MRALLLLALLLTGCENCDRKASDACGNDPTCEPITIGGSMAVACKCYDHPVRRID